MIVIDSSVIIAAYLDRDVHHAKGRAMLEHIREGRWGRGIVPEYVFVETMNVLKRKVSFLVAIEAGHHIQQSMDVDLVPSTEVLKPVWEAFQRDFSTNLSFVDHAIAQVARQRAGGKILTFDRAFRGLPGLTIFPD
ncbi:MAG: PIN domain-containing protein [Bryobacteraceae bacterium]|nr:PIN domain-containing protein [Bryobacteraceae bacterium]